MTRPMMTALLFACGTTLACAGMSLTFFGGLTNEAGEIRGTDLGGPIPYEGEGSLVGAALTIELTPDAARRSFASPQYNPETDRYDDEPEREDYGPHPVAEAKGGIDFAGPLALSLYSLVTIVAGLAIKFLGGDAAQPTPPQ